MKYTKKIAGLLPVIVMLLCMSVTVLAAEKGSVTMYAAAASKEYCSSLTQTGTSGTYSVTWKKDADEAEFSAAALAYAGENAASPAVDKKVKEDSSGEFGISNSADIGQTVEFQTTIKVQADAENYVLHDKMNGLTPVADSIKIMVGGIPADAGCAVVKSDPEDECFFEIVFDNDFIAGLEADTDITVNYSATVNTNAVIGKDGNISETWLDYGKNSSSIHKITVTYTYSFDLINTDAYYTVVEGARFRLYDAATGGNEIKLVKDEDGTYRAAVNEAQENEAVEIEAGNVTIKGLGSADYYLQETAAPAGYSELTERVHISIDGSNLDAEVVDNTWISGGIHVVNYTEPLIFFTGSIGAAIFCIASGALLAGAGIMMVSKDDEEK